MDHPEVRTFAGFELNLRTGELRREDQTVPLERQPALVLTRLVAHHGRLVTRDELRQTVWGDHTYVDFNGGLNYCLRQIRFALGDDARAPRFIETVPRQGYRFVAPLSSTSRPALPRRRVVKAIIAVAIVGVLAGSVAMEVGPPNEAHHQLAVSVARAVHAALF